MAKDGLYGMSAGFAPDALTQAHNLFWFSRDGRDWELRSVHTRPEENRGDEVDLFQTSPGAITVLHRDRRHKTAWRYRSGDAGRTWSKAEDIGDQVEILQRPFITRLTPKTLLLSGRDRKRRLVMVYVSRDWEFRPGRSAEINLRLKVAACSAPGGCMLRVADGAHEEVFTFFPDRIFTNRSRRMHKIDLASGFVGLVIRVPGHNFRVWASGDFTVRSGERMLIDGQGLFTAPAYQGRHTIDFGSGSSAGTGDAHWKWLRYRIRVE